MRNYYVAYEGPPGFYVTARNSVEAEVVASRMSDIYWDPVLVAPKQIEVTEPQLAIPFEDSLED